MKRLLKSKKALSPVVAAIILIAVTVAVSIAVAAWMGALTFTFMKTEEITFTGYTWASDNSYINLQVKNTGSSGLTISEVRVSDVATSNNVTGTSSATLSAGGSVTIQVTKTFTSGVKYEFTLVTAKGNTFGPYVKTAP
jgi:flagellin-like protein